MLVVLRLLNRILRFFADLVYSIKRINLNKKYEMIFYPFETTQCVFFYFFMGIKNSNNFAILKQSEIYKNSDKNNNKYLALSKKLENKNIDEVFNFIVKNKIFPKIISISILDTLIRVSNSQTIIKKKKINKNLLFNIFSKVELAEKLSRIAEKHFITDSSYVFNASLKYYTKKNKKKIFYLNFNGLFFEYLNYHHAEKWINNHDLKEIKSFKLNNKKMMKNVNDYIDDYFSNENQRLLFNFKLKKTEKNNKNNKIYQRKKILYLHCFTDNNNGTYKGNIIFYKYFDWVESALKLISKNYSDWYIKIHPSSIFYHNDKKILNYLILKYKIPQFVFNTPSHYEILSKKMPIFTASGTIALETASKGYKTFVYKRRYFNEISIFIKNLREFKKYYTMKIEDIDKINIMSKKNTQLAKISLYHINNKNLFKELKSHNYQMPMVSEDKKMFNNWIIQNFKSSLESIIRYSIIEKKLGN